VVARLAWVNGVGAVDLLGGYQIGAPAPPTSNLIETINSDLEDATVISPMTRHDLWDFTGTLTVNAQGAESGYGSYSNLVNTSVVQTTGADGKTSKVWNQNYPYNGGTNYAADPTGTGITLTSAPLKGGATDEASIEYDFRCFPTVPGSGAPWGWGGKLPGLAGTRSGYSVPTGGNPAPTGFSARCMWRRYGTEAAANLQANLVGYFYSPLLPANAIGNDLSTGAFLWSNRWHHLKQYHKMNTVTTEGSTNPPADGIHRIWLDGVLVYESTSTVYRLYSDANINRLCWDNFYGGNDASDGKPWGPRVDATQQFDNLYVLTA
jgi:hypothetical protein